MEYTTTMFENVFMLDFIKTLLFRSIFGEPGVISLLSLFLYSR